MTAESGKQRTVHFISIGGAAMHGLAVALSEAGWKVTGSDDEIREPSRSRLEKAGLLPEKTGWFPERITPGIEEVILGMHARKDNPELLRALELGIRVCSFPEFLYRYTAGKRRVVIGGSHGKTTVTSMILHVLRHADRRFDYLVGARIEGFSNPSSLSGAGELAVFEGDEYPSSALDPRPKFHLYHPHIAVITGIAWDHVNVFPRYEDYLEQFREFIRRIEPGGVLIYCLEDPEVRKLAEEAGPGIRKTGYTAYPFTVGPDGFRLRLENGETLPVEVFGSHNMQNIAAAEKVCLELGLEKEVFLEAITSFRGAARRLQLLTETGDFAAYHDFAHAPSKVRATVRALRELNPDRKLAACLELHTYSSLSPSFLPQYRGSLDDADAAAVFFDPAAADLKRLPRLSAEEIAGGFGREGLKILNSPEQLREWVSSLERGNCNLLFMSSGSFGGIDLQDLCGNH